MRILFTRILPALMFGTCVLTAANDVPKIGVLLMGRNPFWSAVEKSAIASGAQLGVELIVKAPASETDVSVQIQMLNALATQGISALVIAPCSREGLAAPVAAVAAKGIKIVLIDSPLSGDTQAVFVATDHQAAGGAAAKLLSTMVGETDEICVFRHSQNGGSSTQRESGAITVLRETRPKAQLHADFYCSTEKNGEAKKAGQLLTTYPKTTGIFTSSTAGTMAMLRVLQERRPAGEIKLVGCGFNLNPEVAAAIESGDLQGWIAQLPQEIGAKSVASAVALIKGESVAPVVHTGFVVITKDNLKKPEVQSLLTF